MSSTPPNPDATTCDREHILDEIEMLRSELATRRTFHRRAPRSVINAYHELLEREYLRLDDIPGE